jgi:hypothetical protein
MHGYTPKKGGWYTGVCSGLYYKCFTIVIYDRNDIRLYYKTRDDHN